jgi:ABC-type glutathione transport system ATPase component
MVVRLGFSVASHLDPDIFLVDEVLAVGDEAFRIKCLERFNEFRESGKTLVFVSHDLRLVRLLCSRAILLDKGQLVADGDVEKVVLQYLEMIESRRLEAVVEESESGVGIKHRGTGEIRIERVTVNDDTGETTDQFFTGKHFPFMYCIGTEHSVWKQLRWTRQHLTSQEWVGMIFGTV